MYANSPAEDITLDEFERLALERLRGDLVSCTPSSLHGVQACISSHLLTLFHASLLSVLKGIEDFKLRGKQGAEMVQKVEELTKKHLQVRQ